jgi:hypothetical protein
LLFPTRRFDSPLSDGRSPVRRVTWLQDPKAIEAGVLIAVALHLQGMREDGDAIPQPTKLADEVEAARRHGCDLQNSDVP